MARDVRIAILGDASDFSRAVDKAESKASGFSSKLKGVGSKAALGFAGVGAGALAFGKSSVSAFMDAEEAQAKLSAAFDKFPALAGGNIKALQDLNSELAKKTKFDDDATASGQAVLASFGLNADQIAKMTPLLQDYATRTGKDLPSAAKDLGKALMGQGKSLKGIGLNLKDTGSLAGNFDAVMGGLTDKVGGFAEKAGGTTAGKVAILKNQFGELQETVGSKLVPVLTSLAKWAGDNIPKAIEKAKAIFEDLKPRIQAVIAVVRDHWPEIQKVIENVMAAVQEVIGTVVAVAQTLWENFGNNVLEFVQRVWPPIQQVIKGVMEAIQGIIHSVLALIQGDWSGVWQGLKDTFGGIWEAIQGAVKTAFEGLRLAIGAVLETIGSMFKGVWDGLVDLAKKAVEKVLKLLDKMLGPLDEIIGKLGGLLGDPNAGKGYKGILGGSAPSKKSVAPVYGSGSAPGEGGRAGGATIVLYGEPDAYHLNLIQKAANGAVIEDNRRRGMAVAGF